MLAKNLHSLGDGSSWQSYSNFKEQVHLSCAAGDSSFVVL